MTNAIYPPVIEIKSSIRLVTIGNNDYKVNVGGQSAMPFVFSDGNVPNNPKVAVEIPDFLSGQFHLKIISEWGLNVYNPLKCALKARSLGIDLLALRISSVHASENSDESLNVAVEIAENIDLPLIILGTNNRDLDKKLLPEYAIALKGFNVLIGPLEEDTYKAIVPECVLNGHSVIARTPIDVNLAKQLNILINEMGLPLDRIVMDPNMGALGYGLDYAYSVVEKIRLAAFDGDQMLNMPIVVFSGEESWRSKEAKSADADPSWGDHSTRAALWEMLSTSGMIMAGSDLVIMRYPSAIKSILEFLKGF